MSAAPRNVVVIGHGMVGSRFAEEVVRRDPGGQRVRVTVVGAEPEPAYNRILMPELLSGRLEAEELRLPGGEAPAVTVRTATAATAIDARARRVSLSDGDALDYDELVLATGARATLLPVPGLAQEGGQPAPGVATLRDMADCRRVLSAARPGAPMVVLGGGLLGLETARALTERGARVSVVEPAPHVLPRQIDAAGGEILAAELANLGITCYTGQGAARWLSGYGMELEDGQVVAADAVVVTAGVRAETELARAAGIAVERGVLVDDTLSTADPRIHAIGDCAQHKDGGAGLVQPGWEQAAVLADLLTGTAPNARYSGGRTVARLKVEGVELTSLGDVHADDEAETITLADPPGGRYAKLSVRDDQVVGAILLGFPDAAATIAQLYDSYAPVPQDRLALLLGRSLPETTEQPASGGTGDAVVCYCNGVTRDQLDAAWRDGARTRDDLAATTRATTGCGGCVRDVNALVAAWSERDSGPNDLVEAARA
ncbi:FAD-dependent oxidoreductase [Salinactinospora qingdaonensis]|uniref:FAD-dependent oxidoreductase n=1 Tax=Salinactinospora qingdaonensis TaxID=702744 RepID=A0ABP7GCB5_9ACTN